MEDPGYLDPQRPGPSYTEHLELAEKEVLSTAQCTLPSPASSDGHYSGRATGHHPITSELALSR